ncbi:MAG: PHB depolymerase family esterase [Microthrixaceae bacterium]
MRRRAWWGTVIVAGVVLAAGLAWWLNRPRDAEVESRRLTSGGVERTFGWFRPESVTDDTARHPAVIVLHGLGLEGKGMAYIGGWGQPAEAGEFVVAFPDGLERSWNAGGCCGASMRNGADDVAFIEDLVAWVRRQPEVDPARVSLAGYSNGGMLALALACDPPEGVSAVVTSGALPTKACAIRVPPDVLLITSPDDPTVPPTGGQGNLAAEDQSAPFPSLTDSLALMGDGNACGAPSASEAPFEGRLTQRSCRDGSRLDAASWPGLGHAYDSRVTNLMVWWLGLDGAAG